MVLAHWGPSRVVQRQALSLNGAHPQQLEVPPIRLAAPGEESDWMHKSQEGQAFHYHALECWKCHEQEDWTGAHLTWGKHQHLLHPGDASSVQQILQGEGLSVLQVRQNRPKQRRSTDSCQEQHQRLSDRHSHGRLWVSGDGDQSGWCGHSAGELLLPQRQTPVSRYHQHRSLQLYKSGWF